MAPVALPSHGTCTRSGLAVGLSDRPLREDLVDIVESSMSSENYDLLKRPDDAYLHARQVNMHTIHKHDERGGTVGEIRAEMRDGAPRETTTVAAWLATQLGPGH